MNKNNAYKSPDPIKYQGKIWDNEPHIIGKSFRRLNEDIWFKQQQDLLLWMANTDYGRELLCIDKKFPKITEFSKKHITGIHNVEKWGKDYKLTHISEFHIGAKWANVIRYRWKEFQEYAQEYYRMREPVLRKYPIMFPVVPYGQFAYLGPFYPDPNPETSTVDGVVDYDDGIDKTWATLHDAAAGGSADDSGVNSGFFIAATATTDRYQGLRRVFCLFDASSIDDGDTIDTAKISFWDRSVGSASFTNVNNLVCVASTPASDTALVAGDYDQTGTVAFSSTFDATGTWTGGDAGYRDIGTFNATGLSNVSKTAVSKFAVVWDKDRSNTEPTWSSGASNNLGTRMADTADTTNDPKLTVTHSVAAAATTPRRRMLFGVGA